MPAAPAHSVAYPALATPRPPAGWVIRWLLPALLLAGIVGSGLTLVYQIQQYRLQFQELERERRERDRLDVEWGRLLIEQQTFGAISQISNRAVLGLRMYSPPAQQVIRLDTEAVPAPATETVATAPELPR